MHEQHIGITALRDHHRLAAADSHDGHVIARIGFLEGGEQGVEKSGIFSRGRGCEYYGLLGRPPAACQQQEQQPAALHWAGLNKERPNCATP